MQKLLHLFEKKLPNKVLKKIAQCKVFIFFTLDISNPKWDYIELMRLVPSC